MAISPPGDIVLDVVRAADPEGVAAARTRLASMANRVSASEGFQALDSVAGNLRAASSKPKDAASEAFTKFEAVILQNFIQTMLPKDTTSVYGEGLSGEMWQSMMAEKLADAVAANGGIGIADRVLKDYYMAGEKAVPLQGVSNDPGKPENDTEKMLSLALVQEIQRKVTQSINQDRAASTTTDSH